MVVVKVASVKYVVFLKMSAELSKLLFSYENVKTRRFTVGASGKDKGISRQLRAEVRIDI